MATNSGLAAVAEMRARMSFVYDAQNDIVEASFRDCMLKTHEDAELWARCASDELERLCARASGKKVWLLINLAGLVARPSASAAFGKLRARVLETYTHASVRYGGDAWTVVSINTSAVLHNTHSNVFQTRPEALNCLLQMRARGRP